MRHEPTPANACADEHGDADGQSTEVTDREQRKRKREIITAHRAAPAETESLRDIRSEHLRRDDDRKNRGHDGSPQHREQTGSAVFDIGRIRLVAAAADLEHFRAGDAFRVGQIGIRHQRAPQRDRIHHAENSAERADQKRDPERKPSPPADHDQTRQHKNDRRQCARR